MSVLKDKNGKISSKRIAGILIAIAAVVQIFVCIFLKPELIEQLPGVIWPQLVFAGGLLGVTVAEKKG